MYKNHTYALVARGQAFVQKLLNDAATSGPVFFQVSSVFASLHVMDKKGVHIQRFVQTIPLHMSNTNS